MDDLVKKYKIHHQITSPYYPQSNVQVENTNKVLEVILTNTMERYQRDQVEILPKVLWAYITTWRNTTRFSPYDLVFGKSPIFPIEFEIKTLKTSLDVDLDLAATQRHRLKQLNELYDKSLDVVQWTDIIQQQCGKWHEIFIKKKMFHKGDWDLLYDSIFKYFKGKFCTMWVGPYEVEVVFENGTMKLTTIHESQASFLVNGHHLMLYHKPTSKDSFVNIVLDEDAGLEVIGPRKFVPTFPTTQFFIIYFN